MWGNALLKKLCFYVLLSLNLWLKHNLQRVHFKSVNPFLLAEDGWLSARGLKLSEASWFEFYQRGRAIWSVFGDWVIIMSEPCWLSWFLDPWNWCRTSGRGHSAKSTDGALHRTEGHYRDKNPDIYPGSDNLGANPGHGKSVARPSPSG